MVWASTLQKGIDHFDSVQHCAACFIKQNYRLGHLGPITSKLKKGKTSDPVAETERTKQPLIFMYRLTSGLIHEACFIWQWKLPCCTIGKQRQWPERSDNFLTTNIVDCSSRRNILLGLQCSLRVFIDLILCCWLHQESLLQIMFSPVIAADWNNIEKI